MQSLQIKAQPASSQVLGTGSKLYIQPEATPVVAEPQAVIEKKPTVKEFSSLSDQEENTNTLIETAEKPVPAKVKIPSAGKKSFLETLRDQHLTNRVSENKKDVIPVTAENLEEHLNCFKEKLKQQSKHSVVTVFNNAKLQVVNEQHFSISVFASLEQKFIEQEKTTLLEYLKDCFHNRNISFTVLVKEQMKGATAEPALTTREKYQKVIEQYPMVKELKDRLKLELDY